MPEKSVEMNEMPPIITIVGPTASGKTKLAVRLAYELGADIISADSRQVYRGMDIGTGKDLNEYVYQGHAIPYHLIDIVDAGEKYNLFTFQQDFKRVYQCLKASEKPVVFCGGTGLYVESVLKGYQMLEVPENQGLRASLEGKPLQELTQILSSLKTLHNTTDIDTAKRAIRAIEIETYQQEHQAAATDMFNVQSLVFGLDLDREVRRSRISARLKARLEEGMIPEVEQLIRQGIPTETLLYYGLEYKFVTLYLTNQLSYQEMYFNLEIAIHQFAKRQMTWFRGMEKRGIPIVWLNALDSVEDNVQRILQHINPVG